MCGGIPRVDTCDKFVGMLAFRFALKKYTSFKKDKAYKEYIPCMGSGEELNVRIKLFNLLLYLYAYLK
jgi:hypothetical protein